MQDVTEPAKTTLSDDAEDVQLAGPLAEHVIGRKIGPVHDLDGPQSAGLEVMDVGSECLAERLQPSAVS